MSTPHSALIRTRQGQRIAWLLGAVAFLVLVGPLLDDLVHGRHLEWGAWLAESGFFLIGLSLAIGLLSAVRHAEGSTTARLDQLRRRTFWLGVALLPVAWLLPAVVG